MTMQTTAGMRPAIRPRLAIGVLATAQLMLVLDVTVVNVALPEIGASLGLEREALTWVMVIYTTVFGGLVLAGGKTADLLGARRVLVAGLLLFMGASLLSALAQNGPTMLVGRGLQGAGAALVSPAALSVLLTSVGEASRGRALAAWGLLSALGTAVGVSAGGLLTASLGWQSIFAINIPIGIAVLAALPVATRPVPGAPARPDLVGAASATLGTGLIVFGLVRAGDIGWTAPETLAALGGGLVAWAVFALVEHRVPEPMLRLSLLTERPVAAGAVLMIVATGLMVGNFFLASFTLQRAFDDNPLQVGLLLLPAAAGVGVGAHLAGRLLDRVAPRLVAVGGLVLAAVGDGVVSLVVGQRAVLAAGLCLAAIGIGAVFVTAFRVALASAGPSEGGLRSALVSTAHELGGAVGVAVLSTVAAAALSATAPMPGDFAIAYAAAAIAAAAGALIAGAVVPGSLPASAAPAAHGHGHGHPHH